MGVLDFDGGHSSIGGNRLGSGRLSRDIGFDGNLLAFFGLVVHPVVGGHGIRVSLELLAGLVFIEI